MYPKNSILQPMFDNFKLKLYQSGVMEKLKQIYFPKPICDAGQVYDQVNFEFARVFFIILAIGVVMAIISGILEFMYNKFRRDSGPKQSLEQKNPFMAAKGTKNVATQTL